MPYRLRLRYTLHQLQILVAVATHGGVSRAAEALHLAQPTVSMQLKQLADAVGAPLVEAKGRGVRLTAAGQEVLEMARAALRAIEIGESRLDALAGGTRGRLRIAAASTAETFIPRLLGDFRRTRPDVTVELKVANRAEVVARVAEDYDDFYVMTQPPSEHAVVAVAFADNPLVVVAPAQHPLARRPRVALAELARHEFVVREPGAGTRLVTDAFLASRAIVLPARLELGSNEAVKQAVIGGLGLAVISLHALRDELLHHHRVRIVRAEGFPIAGRWHTVRRADRAPSPVAEAWMDYVAGQGTALGAELARVLAAGQAARGRRGTPAP
jgi:DNA-binding transcriptional LysR family regulator